MKCLDAVPIGSTLSFKSEMAMLDGSISSRQAWRSVHACEWARDGLSLTWRLVYLNLNCVKSVKPKHRCRPGPVRLMQLFRMDMRDVSNERRREREAQKKSALWLGPTPRALCSESWFLVLNLVSEGTVRDNNKLCMATYITNTSMYMRSRWSRRKSRGVKCY